MDEHTTARPGPAHTGEAKPPRDDALPVTRGRRTLWWLHGAVRFLLALMLLYNGVIKLGLSQFGVPDLGGALIAYGEMSPMGLFSRMVGFSPLFQVLAGVAEVGAAAALVWRRTALVGALTAAASMSFVLVLNLGYDMPGKQFSLALLVMSALVALPWGPRVARALLGSGAVPAAPEPAPFASPRASRAAAVISPVLGVAVLALLGGLVFSTQPTRTADDTPPAGVWVVRRDTAGPAPQLFEDPRWQRVAFGDVVTDGAATVQVRSADGSLLVGTYVRSGGGVVLELRPPRAPGQSAAEYAASPARTVGFDVGHRADGTLVLSRDGQEMLLAPDEEATVLFDRGFHWGIRSDDPFER